MEGKRLNLNRPLISVRRFSAAAGNGNGNGNGSGRKNESSIPGPVLLPSSSGVLRNPGTVPFVWEQTPGRPKAETKTQNPHPVAPNPPPGRRILKQDDLGNDDEKPQVAYGPNFLDHDSDSDCDYDEQGVKFCGLLPHFCLKTGSMGILNPIPSVPMSSARVGSASARSQDAPKSSVKQQKVLVGKEESIEKKGLVSFKELLAHENENPTTIQDFKQNENRPFSSAHNSKQTITKLAQNTPKVSPKPGSDLPPPPPPLPKSPSDSWLWRTLTANHKPHPQAQGQLPPIPET